jgi:hypothetical protein
MQLEGNGFLSRLRLDIIMVQMQLVVHTEQGDQTS